MKVLHVNTFDQGGAAIAAIRLHKALLSHGVDSSMLFLNKTDHLIPRSFKYENRCSVTHSLVGKQLNKLLRKVLYRRSNYYKNSTKTKNRATGFDYFTFNPTDYDITTQRIYAEADIVHLHWTAGFVDYKLFTKKLKPVVWTLHDMNPFTGGCHYSNGCDKYKSECKNCPQLEGTINTDNSYFDQIYKMHFLSEQKNLIITSPSDWLRKCSSESHLFRRFDHLLIPNSLDTLVFKPKDKSFCRTVFNLPTEKKILLFVSDSIENKRKGFDLLLEALTRIVTENLVLCAVGERNQNITYPAEIKFLGRISDERLMALAYSASDAVILPSREDNLPNVMLESLACGTPIISFKTGGMLDNIRTGFNGLLVEQMTAECLSGTLNKFLKEENNFSREDIINDVKINFSPLVQTERYLKVYEKMLFEN